MANKRKYIYGEQFAQKLPGSNQNYYFRTVTTYEVDNNGNPIEGTAGTNLYYAPKPAAKTSNGKIWTSGTADSIDNFNQGGWVVAGLTSDKGKTYRFERYTQEDADLGRIPSGKNVGDVILGATAQQSLSTSGGRFYDAVQNNLINLAANTQSGLAQVVSAKQANAVQQQQQAAAPDPTADPDVTRAVQNAEPINVTIGKSLGRDEFGTYAYPVDLESNKQDRIIFTLKEIKGSTITPTFTGKPISRRISNIKGQVTLPIQPSISDNNSVDWSGASLNAIDAYIAASSLTLMNTPGAAALTSSMQQILGDIATQVKAQSDPLKLFLAQEAAGIQGLVSRATGGVLNPNLELLFNGPQLRPFNFTFRLSPREEREATQVRSIIRFFKEAMSVRTTESNVFLKSPFVFDIKYVTYDNNGNVLPDGGHHPSISRIKTCALLSCDVDYTPDGSYMTFNDGTRTMTSYGLSLRFSELEPIYSTDYTDEKIAVDHIGY